MRNWQHHLIAHLNKLMTKKKDLVVILMGDHGTPDSFFGVSDSSPGACDQKRPYLGVLMPSAASSSSASSEKNFNGLYERLTGSSKTKALFEQKALNELTSSWDLFSTLRHL